MIQAGLVYGRKKSKTHPHMKKFVAANRSGFDLIDLEQTLPLLERALEAIREAVRSGKTILFVGTHPASRDLVHALATETGFPFVTNRWIGGTLTNFKTISERIAIFQKMKEQRANGETTSHTKKERLMMDREIERMKTIFEGVEAMRALPSLLFVVNGPLHETAIREAKKCGILVASVLNTDADPDQITYPIPANDGSRDGVQWILERVRVAIDEGRQARAAAAPAADASPEAAKGDTQ
jgi:small subunit ribosomal protein S2